MENDKWKMLLLVVRRRHKPSPVLIVPGFPNHHNLIDRNVAMLSISIAQVQYAHFHLDHVTTQARTPTAVNV